MRAKTEEMLQASVTENGAASVEWPLLNPDWFGSRRRVFDGNSASKPQAMVSHLSRSYRTMPLKPEQSPPSGPLGSTLSENGFRIDHPSDGLVAQR